MHGSSYLSSLPFLIPPAGMHLRKHVSVRLWMAILPLSLAKAEKKRKEGIFFKKQRRRKYKFEIVKLKKEEKNFVINR